MQAGAGGRLLPLLRARMLQCVHAPRAARPDWLGPSQSGPRPSRSALSPSPGALLPLSLQRLI